ncbi:glycosyltransferase family 4 protein [Sphingomonas japonica]|uniref:Glycosyltransferase involved in cell wall biosynthesis n=1 Tax=Sphingomonas japonica TaxID=511662 RepID=A0ABX0TXN6_9SPHN|nr:glycosyltransferase family 4 protein [Sphingomonas japonica]NIJ23064.1 glycosyltransferase involved in cell wall biosynthesis [Sphingomonas japonica]
MRVAIIAHLKHAIAEPFAGGLEMHTHLLAQSLNSRGHDVTLFASTRSDPTLGLEAICDETTLSHVGTAEAQDVMFFREHHAYLTLMGELRRRDFDLIHNNSLHYLPVAMADTIDTPMVTTLHTPPFCWLESGIRLCRSQAMRFVAVSETIRGLWSPITPIDRVIANGVDLSQFPFNAEPAASPYLVWYGRIVPEKGLHLAIAAAQVMEMPLRFAGPISDPVYFSDQILPMLGTDVEHVGHLDHAALATLIGGARAFLCTPRWEEPYGLVVAEALACGTPVAAFARGAIPSLLNSRSGVLATPDDAVALARAAQSAMALDRRECRARAEAICDARVMVDGYEALYAEMIAANDGARSPLGEAALPDAAAA